MSNAPQLYALYQQLLEQSQLMLRLARQGLWDDLIICETDNVRCTHWLVSLRKVNLRCRFRSSFARRCG